MEPQIENKVEVLLTVMIWAAILVAMTMRTDFLSVSSANQFIPIEVFLFYLCFFESFATCLLLYWNPFTVFYAFFTQKSGFISTIQKFVKEDSDF